MFAACTPSGVQPFETLARDAMLIRQFVYPPLGDKFNNINRHIHLVLKRKRATFANLASIGTTLAWRRAGNLYYSRCFANAMFREILPCQGRPTEAMKRILVFAASNLVQNLFRLDIVEHIGKPTPGRDADHHCRLYCQDCLGNDGTGQSSSDQEESCFSDVLRNRSLM